MNKVTGNTQDVDSPVDRLVMWRCNGAIRGKWCDYRMTDTEMQAHKFDLGCPMIRKSGD